MQRKTLVKPDGRSLHLYSRTQISSDPAPSPGAEALNPNPHLRWHPLRAEWVTYAAQRQGRPFLPPSDYNPLAPTTNAEFPTELPQGDYEIAVFDNRFPSLALGAHDPPDSITPTAAGIGHCEVVVFSQSSSDSLAKMTLGKLELLIQVWTERYQAIGALEQIKYVMPFENRGVEMGVTLHHPHGQIYAYDHVPPVPARELEQQQRYFDLHGKGLLEDVIGKELESAERVVVQSKSVIAFIPAFARYPYEVWIAPIRAAASLAELTALERKDLALVLKTVLLKFDHLFESRPIFPYLMVMHQAPTDSHAHPEAHFHMEFYPPYRTENKLKYLAGTELGAGLVAMDVLPEDKAADLRAVDVEGYL